MALNFILFSFLSLFLNNFGRLQIHISPIKFSESNEVFLDSVQVSYKQYTFKVVSTYIRDSVSYEESNMFNPICVKQTLLFYKNGIKISSQIYPVRMIYQKNQLDEKIHMQENVISEIGVIENGNSFLFTLSGYGGCNSCPMYNALYSWDGKLLWCFYGNEEENGEIVMKKGNLFKALKQKKLNREKYLRGDYLKISTYPDRSDMSPALRSVP